MSLTLTTPPDALAEQFSALQTRRDLADLLEVKYETFDFHVRRSPEARRYRKFKIPKKSGSPREIWAPATALAIIQRKLNQVLQAAYAKKGCVYGFVEGRSIVDNARQHVNRRWVLNVDLRDFFPGIRFGRVMGSFEQPPYGLPHEVAIALAQVCCFKNSLPQGAPTSPIVSNIVAAKLDSRLRALANQSKCTYTRYADDITISTNLREMPRGFGIRGDRRNRSARVGTLLNGELEKEHFFVNPRKVRLQGRHQRQEVTGLIVNGKSPNVPAEFSRQLRAMLYSWEKLGYTAAKQRYESEFCRPREYRRRSPGKFHAVVRGKIDFLGMVRGRRDTQYLDFLVAFLRLTARDAALIDGA